MSTVVQSYSLVGARMYSRAIHGSLYVGPHESVSLNDKSFGSAVSAGLTVVTDISVAITRI